VRRFERLYYFDTARRPLAGEALWCRTNVRPILAAAVVKKAHHTQKKTGCSGQGDVPDAAHAVPRPNTDRR
jgi:hypothetical protein